MDNFCERNVGTNFAQFSKRLSNISRKCDFSIKSLKIREKESQKIKNLLYSFAFIYHYTVCFLFDAKGSSTEDKNMICEETKYNYTEVIR